MTMWRSKKFIIISTLAAVLLVGSIGGIVFAQTGSESDSQPKTLMERVAEILAGEGVNVTPEQLQSAFTQAQGDMQTEARDAYLQKLVDEGKLTREQADQYKAWLQARPDMTPFRQHLREWQQARPDVPSEFKEWQDAKPDVPLPGPFGRFGGHGFHGGMKWGGGPYFGGR